MSDSQTAPAQNVDAVLANARRDDALAALADRVGAEPFKVPAGGDAANYVLFELSDGRSYDMVDLLYKTIQFVEKATAPESPATREA